MTRNTHIVRSHNGKAYKLDKLLPWRVLYWGVKKTSEVAAKRHRKKQRAWNRRLERGEE